MLNPAANGDSVPVLCSYAEEYLELVESLPLDLQRGVSLMREIDAKYQGGFFTLDTASLRSDPITCSGFRQTNKQNPEINKQLPVCWGNKPFTI